MLWPGSTRPPVTNRHHRTGSTLSETSSTSPFSIPPPHQNQPPVRPCNLTDVRTSNHLHRQDMSCHLAAAPRLSPDVARHQTLHFLSVTSANWQHVRWAEEPQLCRCSLPIPFLAGRESSSPPQAPFDCSPRYTDISVLIYTGRASEVVCNLQISTREPLHWDVTCRIPMMHIGMQ